MSVARLLKRVLAVAAALLIAFAAITWWALEAGGVAIVETHTPDRRIRSTHVWFAELDGELWLEAGSPENPWFADLRLDPRLAFRADGRAGEYLAEPIDEPAARARVRAELRAKYGVRDRWVGMLVDQTRSLVVRLVPDGR
jgi:hypothetical protein